MTDRILIICGYHIAYAFGKYALVKCLRSNVNEYVLIAELTFIIYVFY